MEYHYPLDQTWSKEEVVDVINFFRMVEHAYEKGVRRDDLLLAYTRFKQIVPSKSEEKNCAGSLNRVPAIPAITRSKKPRASMRAIGYRCHKA